MFKNILIIFSILFLLSGCSNTVEGGSSSSIISVDAGDDQSAREGETLHFSATLKSGESGDVSSYEWLDDDGSVLSEEASFSTSSLSVKDHIITLKVTDNNGKVASDTLNVSVFVAIYYNGVTYGTVTSPYTGRVWLDRNLGASRVCTAVNDKECYGDYYQWGRGTDGHEKSTSSTTTLLPSYIIGMDSNFIVSSTDWARDADPDGSMRSYNWSRTDGYTLCPITYRVPTIDELKAETLDAGIDNRYIAFSSFLKLPSAGYRSGIFGTLEYQGIMSNVWSNTLEGSSIGTLSFSSYSLDSNTSTTSTDGKTIRCIKEH